jgi:hypothetical protein
LGRKKGSGVNVSGQFLLQARLLVPLPRLEVLDGLAEVEIITIAAGLPRSGTSPISA